MPFILYMLRFYPASPAILVKRVRILLINTHFSSAFLGKIGAASDARGPE